MANISVYQIWPQYLHLRPRYGQKSKIQDGGHRHVDSFKRCYFGPQWPLYGKYVFANQIWCKSVQKLLRYMPVCVFPRWRPSAILDLFYSYFGPPMTFPLKGSIFPANGIMIRSDMTEILWFSAIADLAGKCHAIRANFRQFLGILTPSNCVAIDLTPKGMQLPRRHALWNTAR